MKIAEDYIPEDNNTGLSSDDPLLSSNDDQEQVNDLDESISLLSDEAEVSMLAETSLAKEKNENSTLEELEFLYNSSAEVATDDPESRYDDIPVLQEPGAMYDSSDDSISENSETVSNVEQSISENESTGDSVLEELEDMYGSANESTGENSETVSSVEQSISENKSTGDSVLEELETLFSGDSIESVMDSITDNVETSEAAEHSSNESETSGLSALDELKAFLGEAASNEDSESDDKYM